MNRFTRCGPLMHRVDEDQRIDADPLGFRARGAKNAILMKLCVAGGALIGVGGGLIGAPLPTPGSRPIGYVVIDDAHKCPEFSVRICLW